VGPDDAEDVVQIALMNAFTHLDRAKMSTWISSIIINAALMHLRDDRRRKVVLMSIESPVSDGDRMLAELLSDECPTPEEAVTLAERREIVERLISQLPPRQRQLLHLRFAAGGMQLAEVARAAEKSIGTVKADLVRARVVLTRQAAALA
jgi:RNA polymerase sigma factor (sigma-70 family)